MFCDRPLFWALTTSDAISKRLIGYTKRTLFEHIRCLTVCSVIYLYTRNKVLLGSVETAPSSSHANNKTKPLALDHMINTLGYADPVMRVSGSMVSGFITSVNIGAVNCDRGTFYNIKLIKTSSAVLELLYAETQWRILTRCRCSGRVKYVFF